MLTLTRLTLDLTLTLTVGVVVWKRSRGVMQKQCRADRRQIMCYALFCILQYAACFFIVSNCGTICLCIDIVVCICTISDVCW